MTDQPQPQPQPEPRAEAAPPVEAAAGPQPALAELDARLAELSRAYAEVLNDRESFRRRLERERDRRIEAERAQVAVGLLETHDELERALGTAESGSGLAQGVRLISENLLRRIQALGLVRIEARAGQPFDPAQHDAVDLAPTPDRSADGSVVEEVRAGFRLGDRVVRAAQVRVARFIPGSDEVAVQRPPAAGPALPTKDGEAGTGRE